MPTAKPKQKRLQTKSKTCNTRKRHKKTKRRIIESSESSSDNSNSRDSDEEYICDDDSNTNEKEVKINTHPNTRQKEKHTEKDLTKKEGPQIWTNDESNVILAKHLDLKRNKSKQKDIIESVFEEIATKFDENCEVNDEVKQLIDNHFFWSVGHMFKPSEKVSDSTESKKRNEDTILP